ncbi:MAG: PqqD family protein [Myxococcota bacterium]
MSEPALISLSPHAALKTRAEGDILVLPERAMRLGGSGGEILRLCLTPTTPDEIVAALAARHTDEDSEVLEASVRAFLGEMLELGGVISSPESETR